MAILYQEEQRLFTIHTIQSTYQMKVDRFGYLLHLYYGDRSEGSMEYLLTYADRGFSGNPYEAGEDRTYSLDALPQEYPVLGTGDYRSTALQVRQADGSMSCDLRYCSHVIKQGKYSLPGLPAMYQAENGGTGRDTAGQAIDSGRDMDCETLEITLEDRAGGLVVTLLYGVFPVWDIITRAVKIENTGNGPLALEKVQSACLDFLYGDYDWIQFYGRHAMERNWQRTEVSHGAHVIGSRRGTSSHQYSPFVILAEKDATEDAGKCYGMSFVYSGAFKAEVEKDQFGQTRMLMGLQDEMFSYGLDPGDTFFGPEVIMSYSGSGLSALSRHFHKAIRRNLCRGKYKLAPRPVLVNSWEAAYFDFTGETIYETARLAGELGVEMLVLDDGWFGRRDSDRSGLGDWSVNEGKLGGTLRSLVERVNGLGLKFGIWIEPEMVSLDSDLYRAHPDWAFTIPGRKPVMSRSQLVLDFSRKEVVDYVFDSICRVFDSANIEYVKWDMNRSIADVYSAVQERDRGKLRRCGNTQDGGDVQAKSTMNPGKIMYHYVLGLYDFLERLTKRYPDMLIEGCSGGGGRFDAGMLYYTPQIWCSDNTDAIDRIRIQYGTSFGFPVSSVGSHVSACPNHQTGRRISMETRGVVAMAGSFGYELDPGQLTAKEKACIRKQIEDYHRYQDMIHNGDYYRLGNPFKETQAGAWMFVSEDKGEALVNAVTLETHGNPLPVYIRLKGLEPGWSYRDGATGRVYPGAALMSAGLPVPYMADEYQAWQAHLVKV